MLGMAFRVPVLLLPHLFRAQSCPSKAQLVGTTGSLIMQMRFKAQTGWGLAQVHMAGQVWKEQSDPIECGKEM